jgi:hypothetical protein
MVPASHACRDHRLPQPEFGPGGPIGKEPEPPSCDCGGRFTSEAPSRCPRCRSTELERDPGGLEIMYD